MKKKSFIDDVCSVPYEIQRKFGFDRMNGGRTGEAESQFWRRPNHCLRLFLAGDIMAGRAIDQLFLVHNPEDFGKPDHVLASQYRDWSAELFGSVEYPVPYDYVWGAALGVLHLANPDFHLANLEVAITSSDDWAQKRFNFRMHPDNAPFLTRAALDCCVLANNHLLDFGEQGLLDTIAALNGAGVGFAGAGASGEAARQPYQQTLPGGSRVLVFSWGAKDSGVPADWQAGPSRVGVNFLPDYTEAITRQMVEHILEHKRRGDICIVSVHWGGNWVRNIPEEHRRLAHDLIDQAGVDVIHGHSSHHPLGIETYRGKLILYGCGDLINDYEGNPKYRPMRHHLGAMDFVDLDAETGNLKGLRINPIQRRRFRLESVSEEDAAWIRGLIQHHSARLA